MNCIHIFRFSLSLSAAALSLPDGTGVIKEGNPTPDTDFDASVCEAGESTHYVSIDVLSLGASSDTSRIFQKWDCENDEVTFYSVITAIVHVKDGKPDFISYDDGCFFCGDRDCDETGFNTTAAQMEISSTKRENCGITCSIEDIKNDNCGKCDNGACDLKVSSAVLLFGCVNRNQQKLCLYRYTLYGREKIQAESSSHQLASGLVVSVNSM